MRRTLRNSFLMITIATAICSYVARANTSSSKPVRIYLPLPGAYPIQVEGTIYGEPRDTVWDRQTGRAYVLLQSPVHEYSVAVVSRKDARPTVWVIPRDVRVLSQLYVRAGLVRAICFHTTGDMGLCEVSFRRDGVTIHELETPLLEFDRRLDPRRKRRITNALHIVGFIPFVPPRHHGDRFQQWSIESFPLNVQLLDCGKVAWDVDSCMIAMTDPWLASLFAAQRTGPEEFAVSETAAELWMAMGHSGLDIDARVISLVAGRSWFAVGVRHEHEQQVRWEVVRSRYREGRWRVSKVSSGLQARAIARF